jgi:acetylglutamate kinase
MNKSPERQPVELLKVGGNELDQPEFLPGLAQAIAGMGAPVVIVHGGGRAIAALQERLGIRPATVDGLRVTDAASLAVAQMVLSGQTNKQTVAALLAAGVDAIGLSGVDGGLLRCRPKAHPTADLGFVGEITEVRVAILNSLLRSGFSPVISPISLGVDGQIYNVNADEAAAAVAAALRVAVATFISNVPGVSGANGEVIARLDPPAASRLMEEGTISGGMIPKVRAALALAKQGPIVRIVNLTGMANGGGTWVTNEP